LGRDDAGGPHVRPARLGAGRRRVRRRRRHSAAHAGPRCPGAARARPVPAVGGGLMAGSYQAALELVGKLTPELPADATAPADPPRPPPRPPPATADPRSAPPPCVLVQHTALAYDAMCSGTAGWEIVCLAPGPFNADAWQALDSLAGAVRAALDVERYDVVA